MPPRLVRTDVVTVALLVSRVLLAVWSFALAVVAIRAGDDQLQADRVIHGFTIIGAVVGVVWFGVGMAWSVQRTRNVQLLDGRYPSMSRAVRVWLYAPVWVALMTVTLVQLEPHPDLDVRPPIIVVGFVIAMLAPYRLMQRVFRSLVRVQPDATVFVFYIVDTIAFGLMWWRLVTWPADVRDVDDRTIEFLIGSSLAAAIALLLGLLLAAYLDRETDRSEDIRTLALRTRHDHRLARLQGLDPMDRATRWALWMARQAADRAAEEAHAAAAEAARGAEAVSAGEHVALAVDPAVVEQVPVAVDPAVVEQVPVAGDPSEVASTVETAPVVGDSVVTAHVPVADGSSEVRPTVAAPPAAEDSPPVESTPAAEDSSTVEPTPSAEDSAEDSAEAAPALPTVPAAPVVPAADPAPYVPEVADATKAAVAKVAALAARAAAEANAAAAAQTAPAIVSRPASAPVPSEEDALARALGRMREQAERTEARSGRRARTPSVAAAPLLSEAPPQAKALAALAAVDLDRGGGHEFAARVRELSLQYPADDAPAVRSTPQPYDVPAGDPAPLTDGTRPPRLIVVELLRYLAIVVLGLGAAAAGWVLVGASRYSGVDSAVDLDSLEQARSVAVLALVAGNVLTIGWMVASGWYARLIEPTLKVWHFAGLLSAAVPLIVVAVILEGGAAGPWSLAALLVATVGSLVGVRLFAMSNETFGLAPVPVNAWFIDLAAAVIFVLISPIGSSLDADADAAGEGLAFGATVVGLTLLVAAVLSAVVMSDFENALRGSTEIAKPARTPRPAKAERRSET